MKAILLISILLNTFLTPVDAKNVELYGARPFMSLTHNFNPRWDINLFYSETENLLAVQRYDRNYPARDLQSYFQVGFVYKYSPHLNLTFGYVFQRSNPFSIDYLNENRFWQQVVYSNSAFTGQLSHRFRFEQRFIQDRNINGTKPMATRLRYQIGYTSPFRGSVIVAKSWFYSLYNEFYFSTSGERNTLYSENWTYSGIGYQTQNYGKVELGPLLQYSFTNSMKDSRSLLLLQLGWSLNF